MTVLVKPKDENIYSSKTIITQPAFDYQFEEEQPPPHIQSSLSVTYLYVGDKIGFMVRCKYSE